MKILLDTHVAIWAIYESKKLPDDISKLIDDDCNEIYVSVASLWEVDIKHRKKPEFMPVSADELYLSVIESDMHILPIEHEHIFSIQSINKPQGLDHNDPFDQLIMAQAKAENMMLITADSKIRMYDESFIHAF